MVTRSYLTSWHGRHRVQAGRPGCSLRAVRLSVTTKIFLGLAVVVVTFGLVSIYSVVHLRAIGRELELITGTYLPLTQVATQLESYQEQRGRDTTLLLEQDRRMQTTLITLFRLRYPKLVREKLALGRKLARRGRSLAAGPAEAAYLDEVDLRLARLEKLYDGYDQAADNLYAALEASRGKTADPRLATRTGALRRMERRVGRELKELGRTLDLKVGEQVTRAQTEEDRAALAIMGLSLFAVLVALFVTVFVQRTLRPVRRLTEGVADVRRGNYQRRVEVHSDDEVGDLAREFNAMARGLADREAELDAKRTALLRAERLAAVGRMAAQVSHEIRNPLSSIGLNAELMADELTAARFDDPAHAEEARALLAAIAKEVDRLTDITEEYLRFARMPRPALATEDLGALVRGVLSFTAGELGAAGITVVPEIDAGLFVLADEGQLRRALLNLLRNAREAMAGGGTLTVRAEAAGDDRVAVSVADTGPGIPDADRERIFDPFYSTKERGTGLGLALTQQIVAEHQGTIRCESELGAGTRFRIELPRAAAPARPAAGPDDPIPVEAGDPATALGGGAR